MRKFKFGKLVRDKIVEDTIANGIKPKWEVLSDRKYLIELKNKILEEAQEVPASKNNEHLVEELADVQEVIDSILEFLKVSKNDFNKIKSEKNKKRGSFKKRHYIDYVETSDEVTKWVKYYLDNSDKYPEITNL